MEISSNKKSATKDLLKNNNFVKFLLATLISRFGDSIDTIAYGWMVYKLTGSKVLMGTLYAVNAIPNLIFSPMFGVIVDKHQKKKIMFLGELGRGVIVSITAILFVFDSLRPWHLFIFTFLNSTLETLSSPAKMSIMPLILPKDKMLSASSFSTSASSFAELIGLSAAGIIIGKLGVEGAILIDAATFFIASIIFLTLKYSENLLTSVENNAKSYLNSIKEGFNFVKSNHSILITILIAAFINFLLTPLNVLMPAYIDEVLSSGPEALSMIGFGLTLGMIISGLLVSEFGNRFKEKDMITYGFLIMGIAYSLLSMPSFLVKFVPPLMLAIALFFIVGFSVPIISSPLRAYTLTNTPQEILGRVGAFMGMVCLSAIPLGGVLTGAISSVLSIQSILIIVGIIICIISFALKLNKNYYNDPK